MRTNTLLVLLFGLALGCGDGTLVVDDHNADVEDTTTNNGSTPDPTPTNGSTLPTNNSTAPANNTASPSTNNDTTVDAPTNNDTNNMTVPPTNNTTPGPEFNAMFVAVADFMREKCVACHNMGQNGNFIVPSADVSNADLRTNLEGVVATTGRLLVEPNDPAESQVFIMITNSAGEQFPPETIDLVEAWINAGAPYDP